jgi:nuclear pore complex protein Nup85
VGAGDADADEHGDGVRDEDVGVLNLVPSFYPRNGRRKWAESGRSVGVAVGPVGGERVVWSRKTESPSSAGSSSGKLSESERLLYFAAPHHTTKALHDFYLETATLFASLQQIVALGMRLPVPGAVRGGVARAGSVADAWNDKGQLLGADGLLAPPSTETVGHMRRLVDMYLEELVKIQDASTEVGPAGV